MKQSIFIHSPKPWDTMDSGLSHSYNLISKIGDERSKQNFVLPQFGCGLRKELTIPDFQFGSRVFFCLYRYMQHVLKGGSLSEERRMEGDHRVPRV